MLDRKAWSTRKSAGVAGLIFSLAGAARLQPSCWLSLSRFFFSDIGGCIGDAPPHYVKLIERFPFCLSR